MTKYNINSKVCVIGLGYIGLPTAALLASKGYTVLGADIDEFIVQTINEGRIHIVEPDLEMYVREAVNTGKLKAYIQPQIADVYIICVPTPFKTGTGIPQPNMDYVIAATRSIAPLVKSGDLIILESTSPVGATNIIHDVLKEFSAVIDDVHIAYCPERVLPGKIMIELIDNDRIVGGLTKSATLLAANFYRGFVNGQVLETSARTAEMCKLTENSFRDLNIAFANELSFLCDKANIDVWELISLANHHPRVNILQPGVGVGGHCIAVDPWFIVSLDSTNAKIIRCAREVNDRKTIWVFEKIQDAAFKFKEMYGLNPKIACLGLAFKPDIDDLRESPALHITLKLKNQGYEILSVDPNIKGYNGLNIVDLLDALNQADIVVILVKHKEFIKVDIKDILKEKCVYDFCGALV